MNIINNFQKSRILFGKSVEGRPVMHRTKDEKIEYATGKIFEILAQRAEREVPENGKFSQISSSFYIPESQNEAMLIAEFDPVEPRNLRRLSTGVRRQSGDRLTKSYIFKGTKKELIDFLREKNNQERFIKIMHQLSASVDRHYSEL